MTVRPFHELVPNGDGTAKLQFNMHRYQRQALASQARFVLMLAGFQSGKTVLGALWLYHEMSRRGPGDYLVVTPTFKLLDKKALPTLRELFETILGLGKYNGSDHTFTVSDAGEHALFGGPQKVQTHVFFGHADNPDSLESATAKGAWLDEAGQATFKLGSWEAIQRRLAIHQGRVLISTTPYTFGWLKQKVYDPWRTEQRSGRKHHDIDVVQYDSRANPAFPLEEYDRMRRELPPWKFRMMCQGEFEKPAGMIYDCFDDVVHVMPRFVVPPEWPRFVGLDFGGVNTAAVYLAEEPTTKKLYAYREYWPRTTRTAAEHATALLHGEPGRPTCVGGAGSEDQWRKEFAAAGLAVREPKIKEVEVGIDRVYATIKAGELYVFDDLQYLLAEIGSYSRETDEMGNVGEKIADKEQFHCLDALRYAIGGLLRHKTGKTLWVA